MTKGESDVSDVSGNLDILQLTDQGTLLTPSHCHMGCSFAGKVVATSSAYTFCLFLLFYAITLSKANNSINHHTEGMQTFMNLNDTTLKFILMKL